MTLRATVTPVVGTKTGRKNYYSYRYDCGETSVVGTCYDLARALYDRGETGQVAVFGPTGQQRYTIKDIEKASRLQVTEGDQGLRIRKWKPFPKEVRR